MPKRGQILISFLFLFQLGIAQKAEISLVEALRILEDRFTYSFSYDASLLQGFNTSLPAPGSDIETSLQHILAEQELEYVILSSTDIIIRPFSPQEVELCGYIKDQMSAAPLPYAHVRLGNTSKGAYSDENGFFNIKGKLPKHIELTISYLGYKTATEDAWAFITPNCKTIKLKANQTLLSTVLVKEFTTEMLEASNPNGIHFKPQKIPTLPGWGEPDLLRSLQLLPGISSADESAANINIRGGSSDQNLILWDDIPIYHTGHLFGFSSSINPFIARSMDIHRGGFGAEYGGRVSGVVDIKGKPTFKSHGEYGIGMNLINAHGYAEIPIRRERSALLIAFRRSFTDLIQSATYQNIFRRVFSKGRLFENQDLQVQSNGFAEAIPTFFYNDLNLKWSAKPTDNLNISISYFIGNDALDYRFTLDTIINTRDELDLSNSGTSINLAYDWNDKSTTLLKLIGSNFSNSYGFELGFGVERAPVIDSRYTNELQDGKITLQHNWQIDARNAVSIGGEVNGIQVNYKFNEQRQGQDLAVNVDTYNGSIPTVFLNYEHRIPDKFTLEMGLRAEAYAAESSGITIFETGILLPRYAIRYHPFDRDFYFQSSGGLYRQYVYQLPAFYNDLGAGENIWVLANGFFPILNGAQVSAGFGFTDDHFLMEVEPYFKIVNNLSSWKVELEDGIDNPFTHDGTLVAMGIDALVKKRWNKYSIWAAYSLAYAGNQYQSLNAGELFPTDYDQRHRLNFTQMLSIKRWDFSSTFNLTSGRPFTQPEAIGFNEGKETNMQEYFLVYQNQNNARLPVYHRLDIAANYKFGKKRMRGKVGLSVFNLYNQSNLADIDFLIFPSAETPSSPPEITRLERPMLSVTPNLFFQMTW